MAFVFLCMHLLSKLYVQGSYVQMQLANIMIFFCHLSFTVSDIKPSGFYYLNQLYILHLFDKKKNIIIISILLINVLFCHHIQPVCLCLTIGCRICFILLHLAHSCFLIQLISIQLRVLNE